MLNPLDVTPENVWSYEQNRPSLVADDLEAFGVPREVTYAILMARGVFKWLSVRRDLIRVKDHWRCEVMRLVNAIKIAKVGGDQRLLGELRARLKAYEECRQTVSALCHSERWRAPDIDGDAWQWLVSRAPFKVVGKWAETARNFRHARLGSDDVSDVQLVNQVGDALAS